MAILKKKSQETTQKSKFYCKKMGIRMGTKGKDVHFRYLVNAWEFSVIQKFIC